MQKGDCAMEGGGLGGVEIARHPQSNWNLCPKKRWVLSKIAPPLPSTPTPPSDSSHVLQIGKEKQEARRCCRLFCGQMGPPRANGFGSVVVNGKEILGRAHTQSLVACVCARRAMKRQFGAPPTGSLGSGA